VGDQRAPGGAVTNKRDMMMMWMMMMMTRAQLILYIIPITVICKIRGDNASSN
jgi:hypothetical protein